VPCCRGADLPKERHVYFALKTGVRVGSSTLRSGSIAKEAKALAVAWASVRECHQKRVRAGPGRHDLPNLPDWSVASPHVATISKTVVAPLSQLPRLLRRLSAGSAHLVARTFFDTRHPFVSTQLACQFLHHGGLTRQWEHFSQDRPAGRVTSSGRACLTLDAPHGPAGCHPARICPSRAGPRLRPPVCCGRCLTGA
jgi:hypothetical protein